MRYILTVEVELDSGLVCEALTGNDVDASAVDELEDEVISQIRALSIAHLLLEVAE